MKTQSFFRMTAALVLATAALSVSCKKDIDDTKLREILIIDPSGNLTLEQGDEFPIVYDIVPAEAAKNTDVEWISSDEVVAKVNSFGRIYAYTPGNATITAKCGDVKAEFELTVKKVDVTSFSVPKSLKLLVGVETEVEVSIKPEKLNATALEWVCDNPEIVEHAFRDGKVFLRGLKEGSCNMTVKSEKAGTSTISLSVIKVTDRFGFGYFLRDGTPKDLKDGDEVFWNLMGSQASLSPGLYPALIAHTGEGISITNDVTVTSSNTSVCREIKFQEIFGDKDEWASYTLCHGGGFGSTTISFTIQDPVFKTEIKQSLTLTRNAVGIPDEMVVTASDGTLIKNGGTYQMARGTKEVFSINSGYSAKWSLSSNDIASITHISQPANKQYGDEYWSPCAEVQAGENLGSNTVQVSDQKGKSMSFQLDVTEPFFPEDLHIVNPQGKKAEGIQYVECGYSGVFQLSNSGYKAKWTISQASDRYRIEPIDPVGEYSTKVKVSVSMDAWRYEPCILTATDESGVKKREVTIQGPINFNNVSVSLRTAKGYSTENFYWEGSKTNHSSSIYVYDQNGNSITRLPGATLHISYTSLETPDFKILTSNEQFQTTGKADISWNSKFAEYVRVRMEDYRGKVGPDCYFIPKIDFSSGEWNFGEQTKDGILWYDPPKPNKTLYVNSRVSYGDLNSGAEQKFLLRHKDDANIPDNWCRGVRCEVNKYKNASQATWKETRFYDINKNYINTFSTPRTLEIRFRAYSTVKSDIVIRY